MRFIKKKEIQNRNLNFFAMHKSKIELNINFYCNEEYQKNSNKRKSSEIGFFFQTCIRKEDICLHLISRNENFPAFKDLSHSYN